MRNLENPLVATFWVFVIVGLAYVIFKIYQSVTTERIRQQRIAQFRIAQTNN